MTSYYATWRHLGTCQIYHLPNPEPHKSGFKYLREFIVICSKFNVLALIWWVNHQNWTRFDEVIGFYFLLRNFPDFDRFLLILAQFVLTSSLFWIFFDISRQNSSNWTFLPKILKIALFLQKIWGWGKFTPPPQDGGFGDPPQDRVNKVPTGTYS